jgi:ubiquinone/menaquinone biosynthesis C-methylase UbiE
MSCLQALDLDRPGVQLLGEACAAAPPESRIQAAVELGGTSARTPFWMESMDDPDREREFWEKHAASYDRVLKLFGRPFERMLSLVSEAVSGAANVLEVAAGTGLVTVAVAPHVGHLVATDYAAAMLDALRKRVRDAGLANVECEPGDIYTLAYPSGSFDAVVACNVLHLVPDLPTALQALCRVLSVGGKLIAPTFCHDETLTSWVVSRVFALSGQPMHRRFTTASLREALEQAGVGVRRVETIPGLIPIGYVEGVIQTPR